MHFFDSTLKFLVLIIFTATLLLGCSDDDDGPGTSCGDGVLNGSELAIDCGGPECPKCECQETMQDIDGNIYNVVSIGGQCWTQSNLLTTRYNDGEEIPNITDDDAWIQLSTGALCDYQNEVSNSATYGKLYNWHAVNSNKLCPQGWHIPTVDEWLILINRQPPGFEGGSLKAIPIWQTPNVSATNSSGFTALPGGARSGGGGFFSQILQRGYFYSSTDSTAETGVAFVLINNEPLIFYDNLPKEEGASCRCIKGTGPQSNPGGYDCIDGTCATASSGGEFSTLAQCQNSCSSLGAGYICSNNNCELVGTGASFATIAECQAVCGDDPTPNCNISVSITNVSGNSATASASGGNPPYNYVWSNGSTGETASGLAPGTYTVTASEVSNPECTASADVTITGTSGDNCCDCPPDLFTCVECCDGNFDMLGENWAFWEALFTASGCDCN